MRLWNYQFRSKSAVNVHWTANGLLLWYWGIETWFEINWYFVTIENLYIVTIFHWTNNLKVLKLQLYNCKSVVYFRLWLIQCVKFIHLLLWIWLEVICFVPSSFIVILCLETLGAWQIKIKDFNIRVGIWPSNSIFTLVSILLGELIFYLFELKLYFILLLAANSFSVCT